MLGSVATVCIVVLEVGALTYSMNKNGVFDGVKAKVAEAKLKYCCHSKAKDLKDIPNDEVIIEAKVLS